MTQGFFQSLINRGNNALDKLGNALFGVYPSGSAIEYNNNGYTQAQNDYLNSLDNEDYFKNLISGPKQTTLTPQQYKDGVMQGLNFGIPQIAQKQKELNINIPQTGEDIENARIGEFNQYPVINGSVTSGKRQGGIFNDIEEGYKDNYTNGFSFENWQPENKSLANRIGEGLGTLRRFIDSPLGRGLLMAGVVGGTGGSGLEAITYGLTSGVGRQNNIMKDTTYRKYLNEMGIDTSDIRGIIDGATFKQIMEAKQLQDNAEYRKMYFDAQQKQNEIMNQIRADQLKRQQRQDEVQNQLDYSKLGIEQQKLNAYRQSLENKANKTTQDKALLKQINENASTLADIDAGLQLIEENPQAYTWFKGKVGADIANRIDPKGVPTRTQIDNITAVYRKWLTGAQMSDQERQAYERFLPAPTDNAQIVKSKLQNMKNSIERKNRVLMQGTNVNNTEDNDPLGIL